MAWTEHLRLCKIQGQTGVTATRFPEWFFSDPNPTFQMVSDPYLDPDPVSDPTLFFSNILNINFTFVFPSCKCVRLHIMTRYKLLRKLFYIKRNIYF